MDNDQPFEVRDDRKYNFFMVDNVIIDHYASIIGALPTLVYCALCRHANRCTRETFPSFSFLAKELRLSRSTVIRAIRILLAHQLIARKHRKSKTGDDDTNIYIILEPWGSVPQTPPLKPAMLHQSNNDEEVVSDRHHLVSQGHQGSVPQTLGVVSQGHPNNTKKNKSKDTPPTPSSPKRGRQKVAAHPIPDEYQPSEKNRQGILARYPGANINRLVEAMESWAHSGGIMKCDWEAELRTFARKDWESRGCPDRAPLPTRKTYQVGEYRPDGSRQGKIL